MAFAGPAGRGTCFLFLEIGEAILKWQTNSGAFGTYLDAGLGQLGAGGQLLAVVDVGVLGLGEGGLEDVELLLGEGGAVAAARGGRVGVVEAIMERMVRGAKS